MLQMSNMWLGQLLASSLTIEPQGYDDSTYSAPQTVCIIACRPHGQLKPIKG